MASQQPEFADELTLADGRTLAYTEYGDPDGTPVVFCHGTPGSRVSGTILREAAAERGVRLIAPDRPGFGRSEFVGDRTFADWASDVTALVDSLGVHRFAVLGFSGGGPYALACAAHAPDRVIRCAAVSTAGPPGVATADRHRINHALRRLGRWSPHLGRPLVWLLRREIESADRFTDVVGDPTDGDLADPRVGETGRILLSDMQEAVRQGSLPLAADYGVLGSEWDFALADVAAPTHLFHGNDDENAPLAAAKHVADALPDGDLTVVDCADHFRPLVEHAGDVLSWLDDGKQLTLDAAIDEGSTGESAGDSPGDSAGESAGESTSESVGESGGESTSESTGKSGGETRTAAGSDGDAESGAASDATGGTGDAAASAGAAQNETAASADGTDTHSSDAAEAQESVESAVERVAGGETNQESVTETD